MRRICVLPFLAVTCIAISPDARALGASEVFARTRDAIYLVIVTTDDLGVVDVTAQGSAVLIAPGRFVTNCHVLEGGKHFVISRREDKVVERVLLVNYEKGRDLCELDLAKPRPGFDKPAQIAPAGSMRIGAPVFAIGSPRGLELTISNGIVSGFREANDGMQLIQTTAPFSPGSSGGGLFDDQARLIGITTFIAKDSQNLNFAVSAQYIPSANISAQDLFKQRSGATAKIGNAAAQEIAFERQERLRRDEQDSIAARKKQLDAAPPAQDDRPASLNATPQAKAAMRKPVAARLAPYQSMRDNNFPARLYVQMAKKGELAGIDDDAAICKVYEALIRQSVAAQLRWNEGGGYISKFQVQLRRSGEVMFVIPAVASGIDRFDEEAQRAIGAASPLPVPQDNDAFARMSEITITVQAPERAPAPIEPVPGKKRK